MFELFNEHHKKYNCRCKPRAVFLWSSFQTGKLWRALEKRVFHNGLAKIRMEEFCRKFIQDNPEVTKAAFNNHFELSVLEYLGKDYFEMNWKIRIAFITKVPIPSSFKQLMEIYGTVELSYGDALRTFMSRCSDLGSVPNNPYLPRYIPQCVDSQPTQPVDTPFNHFSSYDNFNRDRKSVIVGSESSTNGQGTSQPFHETITFMPAIGHIEPQVTSFFSPPLWANYNALFKQEPTPTATDLIPSSDLKPFDRNTYSVQSLINQSATAFDFSSSSSPVPSLLSDSGSEAENNDKTGNDAETSDNFSMQAMLNQSVTASAPPHLSDSDGSPKEKHSSQPTISQEDNNSTVTIAEVNIHNQETQTDVQMEVNGPMYFEFNESGNIITYNGVTVPQILPPWVLDCITKANSDFIDLLFQWGLLTHQLLPTVNIPPTDNSDAAIMESGQNASQDN